MGSIGKKEIIAGAVVGGIVMIALNVVGGSNALVRAATATAAAVAGSLVAAEVAKKVA